MTDDSTTSALTGRRIGVYQLRGLLGAGGMGEVYRAHDTKLGRDVAIKVLPHAFVLDAERTARFTREARLLASLNHPNIATIHAIEDGNGVLAIVMELIEGPTLAERVAKGPLAIPTALEIVRQIATALDAAHERGIVHRDLKPANVKITPDGTVKVLDFGLAKLQDAGNSDLTADPALTVAETRGGLIMGTAPYMSPEQARGQPVDKRTDIWAFGCVLYEILVGRAAFASGTISDTIAAILERQPDWNALPAATPARVLRLVKRCLEKDPRARLRDIGDARAELDEAAHLDDQPRTKDRKKAGWFLLAAAMSIGATTAVAASLILRRTPPLVWAGVRLGGTEIAAIPRISPDGHTLAFAATVGGVGGPQQVAVMKPETGNRVILTRKEDGWLQCLSWSVDGTHIYYDRVTDVPRGIFRVPVLGGEEQLVLEDAGCPDVLSDGSLLVWRLNAQRQTQLFRFWPETGQVRGYTVGAPNGIFISAARGFPDGRQAAVIGAVLGRDTAAHLYILDLESGNVRQLSGLPDESNVLSVATTRDGKSVIAEIMAGDSVRIVAIPVNGGTLIDLFTSTSQAATIDTGPDGSIYLEQYERPIHLLRFRAEGGHAESISPVFFPGFGLSYGAMHTFAVLPDGRVVVPESISGHIQLMVIEDGKGPVPLVSTTEETTAPVTATAPGEVALLIGPAKRRAIATASISSGRITHRISFDKGDIASLASAPDGQTLYAVANGTVWKVPVSGTELTKLRAGDAVAVSPDGRTLLVEEVQTPTIRMFRVPLNGGPEQEIRYAGPSRLAPQGNPNAISKDGRIVTPLGTSTWHQPPGLLDPATGRLAPINIDYVTDVHSIGWSPDGEVIALGFDLRATMWRFAASGR